MLSPRNTDQDSSTSRERERSELPKSIWATNPSILEMSSSSMLVWRSTNGMEPNLDPKRRWRVLNFAELLPMSERVFLRSKYWKNLERILPISGRHWRTRSRQVCWRRRWRYWTREGHWEEIVPIERCLWQTWVQGSWKGSRHQEIYVRFQWCLYLGHWCWSLHLDRKRSFSRWEEEGHAICSGLPPETQQASFCSYYQNLGRRSQRDFWVQLPLNESV